jgi:hypothetical protein
VILLHDGLITEARAEILEDFRRFDVPLVHGCALELVSKPHKHFFNVTMTQASWKKATNILI